MQLHFWPTAVFDLSTCRPVDLSTMSPCRPVDLSTYRRLSTSFWLSTCRPPTLSTLSTCRPATCCRPKLAVDLLTGCRPTACRPCRPVDLSTCRPLSTSCRPRLTWLTVAAPTLDLPAVDLSTCRPVDLSTCRHLSTPAVDLSTHGSARGPGGRRGSGLELEYDDRTCLRRTIRECYAVCRTEAQNWA